MTGHELALLAPLLALAGAGCLVLLIEALGRHRRFGLPAAIAGCLAALVLAALQWQEAKTGQSAWSGMWITDRMALLLDGVVISCAALTLLVAGPFMREHEFENSEHHALVLFGTAGMVTVVHAAHLLSLLIGIELMSMPAYLLVASWRRQPRGAEGALKYLLMGAFASAVMVYGMALMYGTTGGEMELSRLAARTGLASADPLFMLGMYMVLAGMLFKIAAVPFHMWVPDAYEGAPTPVTGFMAAGIKVAAVGGLLRLLGSVLATPSVAEGSGGWVRTLGLVSLVTMTLGNLAALRQENVKRMLAYSSVAHAGYLLVGMAALGLHLDGAQSGILLYLCAYAFTTVGAFAVVAWVGRRGDERLAVTDWAGLAKVRPGVALAMTVFLLSLAGVPPTGGFFGKFLVFRAAMQSPELRLLVIAGVLNSLVSVYYYLRLVVAMYFQDEHQPWQPYRAVGIGTTLAVAALVVLGLGVTPGWLMDLLPGTVASLAGR